MIWDGLIQLPWFQKINAIIGVYIFCRLVNNQYILFWVFIFDRMPAPEMKEICRLHNKIYTAYHFFGKWANPIYSDITIDSGMKDRFIYHNRYLTIKILNQTAFFEKCACLLSAIYLNIWHQLNFCDIHFKYYIYSKLRYSQGTWTRKSVKFRVNFDHIKNLAEVSILKIFLWSADI